MLRGVDHGAPWRHTRPMGSARCGELWELPCPWRSPRSVPAHRGVGSVPEIGPHQDAKKKGQLAPPLLRCPRRADRQSPMPAAARFGSQSKNARPVRSTGLNASARDVFDSAVRRGCRAESLGFDAGVRSVGAAGTPHILPLPAPIRRFSRSDALPTPLSLTRSRHVPLWALCSLGPNRTFWALLKASIRASLVLLSFHQLPS